MYSARYFRGTDVAWRDKSTCLNFQLYRSKLRYLCLRFTNPIKLLYYISILLSLTEAFTSQLDLFCVWLLFKGFSPLINLFRMKNQVYTEYSNRKERKEAEIFQRIIQNLTNAVFEIFLSKGEISV